MSNLILHATTNIMYPSLHSMFPIAILRLNFLNVVEFYLCVLEISLAVHINYIKVPIAVKNNSGQSVILDCNFSYRTDDIDLVVKWVFNDEIVYKWIPSQKPQALGHFKNKLDTNYAISDDPKTAYRAMKILNPITKDAGEYKCFISTFADEDFSARNMTVFGR